MRNYKNNNFKLYSLILKKSTVIAIVLLLLFNFIVWQKYHNISLFLNINEAVCFSIVFCIAIIAFMKDRENSIIKLEYYGIGNIFIGIFSFIKIVLLCNFYCYINSCEMNNIKFIIVVLELIIQVAAAYFYSKQFSRKKSFFIYMIIAAIVILGSFYICTNKYLIVISLLIMLLLYLFLVFYFIYKIDYKAKDVSIDIFYMTFEVIFVIYYMASLIHGITFIVISSILRCIIYIFRFKIIESVVLKQMFIDVQKKLIRIEKSNIDMNIELKERNKALTEFKYLIEDSESRYRQLLSYIQDGVMILNKGEITFINDYMVKLIERDTYSNIKNIINKVKDAEEIGSSKKIVINMQDNLEFEVYYVRIDNKEEMIYFKDITEIIRAYDARKKYIEFLQNEKSKNEFYSNISHELRTPINLVYSAIQLNKLYIQKHNKKGIQNNYKAIRHNCLRLIRTISNFIDANKISEGYMNANIHLYNIVSVIENISIACKKYIEYISDNLIFDSVEEEIYVSCDKDMIERVIMNLISNIVKYGKPNGNVYINIEIEEDNVIIILRVDNYTIKDEYKKIMFDKFTKLNKEFTRTKEGSGLGLYLVRELLKLNNGSIFIETDKQHGTSFIIKMPISHEKGDIDNESMFEISSLEEKVDTEFSDIYL